MRVLFSCLLVVGFLFALSGSADSANVKPPYVPVKTVPTDMELIDVGVVKDVLKSNSIQMQNGSVFVLDGIRTPVIYEKVARDYVTELLKGKTVGLYVNKTIPSENLADDHGNEIAHVVIDDGTWAQQKIVSKGLAWVDSTPKHRDLIQTLYKYEIQARAGKLGFWSNPAFKVRNQDNMGGTVGTFQIFEGRPVVHRADFVWDLYGFYATSDARKRTMTISLKREDYLLFPSFSQNTKGRGFIGADLANSRMRVRGWVETMPNGTPMIRLTHPEQLELPDGPPVVK
jgi:hypothetical protein